MILYCIRIDINIQLYIYCIAGLQVYGMYRIYKL